MSEFFPDYFKYWGKAGKDGSYHLLPYHCLDVAAVGQFLMNPQKALCSHMAEQLCVEAVWLNEFFTFCLALHDIGKFSRAFQGIVNDLSSDLVKANPRMVYKVRHDTLGFLLWRENLSNHLKYNSLNNNKWLSYVESWLEIVTGHHGMPPKKSGERLSNFFEPEDEKAAFNYVQDIFELFPTCCDNVALQDKSLKKKLKPISWQLAGICVLADWLGSNRESFEYCAKPKDLAIYWREHALHSAEKAIQSLPSKPKSSRFKGVGNLFPFIKSPTPLQEYAISEHLCGKQHLFILEDVTGAGKTEAALILTQRLLSEGLADGLYVALPTMATANAMYHRLGKVYRNLYEEGEMPSLILAHGARELYNEFRESVTIQNNSTEDMIYGQTHNEFEPELSASVYCNAWLADNRKKALLADIGVGTIDQVLLAVLPARHQSLRLLGLGRKVLLVDEAHAYDSYMQNLLDSLIEAHTKQGGSVIILSATLPQQMRENLFKAFHRGLGETASNISSNSYPLATHSPAVKKSESGIKTRREVKRSVIVKQLDTEEAVIDQIRKEVNQGKCVCWIRNTVRAAWQSYKTLSDYSWLDRGHLALFHSRFAMIDRQEIETETLRKFGENSTHEDRKGQILIATQVVEQSLDLDFDVLITDLAPIDLIIQRAGRLCRHTRDEKGNRLRELNSNDKRGTPILFLFCPEPKEDIDANWLKNHQDGTQAVYPHIGQLWLTAKLLLDDLKGKFTMPDNARDLIEGIYSDEAECRIPNCLEEASLGAISKNLTKKSLADLNALKLNKGYTWSSGDWDEETHIPTRLTEQETVSVALAKVYQNQLQPYAKGAYHEWAMSVVKIPDKEWKKVKQDIDATMQEKIEDLKKETKALHWMEVFPLTDETQSYYSSTDGWQIGIGE